MMGYYKNYLKILRTCMPGNFKKSVICLMRNVTKLYKRWKSIIFCKLLFLKFLLSQYYKSWNYLLLRVRVFLLVFVITYNRSSGIGKATMQYLRYCIHLVKLTRSQLFVLTLNCRSICLNNHIVKISMCYNLLKKIFS